MADPVPFSEIREPALAEKGQLPVDSELGESPQLDPTEEEKSLFIQAREQWHSLLLSVPNDGDAWFVISKDYLNRVMTLEHPQTLQQLADSVGKIECASIVDANGNLFPEEEEPVPTAFIHPDLFNCLVSHLGIVGTPVVRHILVEGGVATMERFPPFFVVHTLTKSSAAPARSSYDRSGIHSRCEFLLSQTKTFRDLLDTIQSYMFKATKTLKFRLWFITADNLETLPAAIPATVFLNKVSHKKVVGPAVLDATLQSQGIRSSRLHLVVEAVDRTTKKFPIDLLLASTDLDLLDFQSIVSQGGNLGLSNLGNTCYMNSALQCLVHVPEVNYYFFFDLFERELNRDNPLGNKGEVAVAFSNLLHKLFDSNSGGSSSITPREFKYTIGRYSSMFHGYQQQDSQEFLSWLLDALHEDLNRIHDKPYCEKPELKDEDVDNPQAIIQLADTCWDQHKKRNDSIIVDLFTGMYQSTLVCPKCSKKSVTFDPFNDLTLPLPVNKKWYHTFTICDLSGAPGRGHIMKLEVELNKSSNYDDLVEYLSHFLKVPSEHLFLFEIFRNFFYKNFQENTNRHKFLPVGELISDTDTVIVYIIPHNPTTDIIVPLVNIIQDEDKSYNVGEPFGFPLFVVLNKEDESSSFGTIRHRIEQTVKLLTRVDLEAKYREIKGIHTKKYFTADDFPLMNSLHEDTVMVDGCTDDSSTQSDGNGDSDAYDSDISLAHPTVGGSFGFVIKYYEDDPSKRTFLRGSRHARNNDEEEEQSSTFMHIPRGRPQFTNMPVLANKLPETKRKYYHYPDLVAQVQAEERAKQNIPHLDEEGQEYVMVDLKVDSVDPDFETETAASSSNDNEHQLLDEDTDSDTNWDNVNTLFASVDQLGPPGAPTCDSDRDITSEIQSPRDIAHDKVDKHVPLVDSRTTLVCEWDISIYNQFFKDPELRAWEDAEFIPNPQLEENKRKLALQQKSTVSLYDCFRNFSTPEVLGDQDLWYCPRCKDHRRATKTIQVWSTGDILTIHLKRFQSAKSFSDKINMVVDFPIEGLDMKDFVASSLATGNNLIYDLVAVDNHYGGLGGGHYTASAKNFRDNKWYYFNDGRVTPIEDPKECISGAAYLLFYKKRSTQMFAGGNSLEHLLAKGRGQFELKLAKIKEQLLQVLEQIELYNQQELDLQVREEAEKKANEPQMPAVGDNEDDLYEDRESDVKEDLGLPNTASGKKGRSPMTEQAMKFEYENQRKQRLISKDADLPRSVNINMGYSSSVSNLASPNGSVSSEEDDSPSVE